MERGEEVVGCRPGAPLGRSAAPKTAAAVDEIRTGEILLLAWGSHQRRKRRG